MKVCKWLGLVWNPFGSTSHHTCCLSCVSVVHSAVLQSDDPEGEIELMTCVNVSDCEVEKNHGFQIQVRNRCVMFSHSIFYTHAQAKKHI